MVKSTETLQDNEHKYPKSVNMMKNLLYDNREMDVPKNSQNQNQLKVNHSGKNNLMKSILTKNQKEPSGAGPYPCNQCGKKLVTKMQLTWHLKLHREDKLHQCNHCGRTFAFQHFFRHASKSTMW